MHQKGLSFLMENLNYLPFTQSVHLTHEKVVCGKVTPQFICINLLINVAFKQFPKAGGLYTDGR